MIIPCDNCGRLYQAPEFHAPGADFRCCPDCRHKSLALFCLAAVVAISAVVYWIGSH